MRLPLHDHAAEVGTQAVDLLVFEFASHWAWVESMRHTEATQRAAGFDDAVPLLQRVVQELEAAGYDVVRTHSCHARPACLTSRSSCWDTSTCFAFRATAGGLPTRNTGRTLLPSLDATPPYACCCGCTIAMCRQSCLVDNNSVCVAEGCMLPSAPARRLAAAITVAR